MNNNQSSSAESSTSVESTTDKSADRPLKPDPKGKAITSFVLGILSVGVLALLVMCISLVKASYQNIILGLSLLLAIPGIIGLISGIKGLKSTKRNFAIFGIILCLIGLLVCLWVFGIYAIAIIAYSIFGTGSH